MLITRRHLLLGLSALPLAPALARAQALDATTLGLVTGSVEDQSAALQDALQAAAAENRPLFLPAGSYFVGNLQMPSRVMVHGIPGATVLSASNGLPVARIAGCVHSGFVGVGFVAGPGGPAGVDRGLIEIEASNDITIDNCVFSGGAANGIVVRDAGATITGCALSGHGLAGLFAVDSRGLKVSNNRITGCGNGGVLVWASTKRHDGSIISDNTISGIGATNGGSGQNGNGIHVFLADDVIAADNQITDCASSAVRINSGANIIVSDNLCRQSGATGIVAEFGFSGAVISGNVVDGAASGILIGSANGDGRLSSCTGNVVRNIRAAPEASAHTPFGIAASIDTTISGNSVDAVAGIAIRAGQDEVRNLAVTGNAITASTTGIAVRVSADPPPGPVTISGNVLGAGVTNPLVAMDGETVVSADLGRDIGRYPHISLGG